MSENNLKWGSKIFMNIFSIIILRNLLEMLLKKGDDWNLMVLDDYLCWWVHNPLFYFTLVIGIIFIADILLNISLKVIIKSVTAGFSIILIGPITDYIMNVGSIPYLYVKDPAYIVPIAINIINPSVSLLSIGVTPGPRLEIFIATIFSAVFVYLQEPVINKFEKVFLSVVSAIFIYLWIVFLCMWPAVIYSFHSLSEGFVLNNIVYSKIYLSFLLIFCSILIAKYNKPFFVNIVRFIRPKRYFHYLFIIVAGVLISIKVSGSDYLTSMDPINFFLNIFFPFIAFTSIFISTTIINDLTDYAEDSINNRNLINSPDMRNEAIVILIITFIIAMLTSYLCSTRAMSIILGLSALNIIYSVPPIRLKVHFPFAYILLALGSVLMYIFGAILFNPINIFSVIKIDYVILIFVVTLFGAFIKDLPDYKGDKNANIKTLPVLLSPASNKLFYSILLISVYGYVIIFGLSFSRYSIIIALPAVFSVKEIIQNPFSNSRLFIAYFISFFLTLTFIFIK